MPHAHGVSRMCACLVNSPQPIRPQRTADIADGLDHNVVQEICHAVATDERAAWCVPVVDCFGARCNCARCKIFANARSVVAPQMSERLGDKCEEIIVAQGLAGQVEKEARERRRAIM